MNGRRPKRWRKFPDAPLGAIVDGALQHRAQKGTAEAESAAARLRSVRSRFDRMAPSDNPLLPPAMVRRFRASLAEDDETDCA
ncbi:hypothetical protein [Streptomyces sp. NPDC001930]|uniref:hypothetical protein n=1 Tax=Streptomyces sp. NPDC001930 TaxID=3364625 RepID=UPI0036902407